MLRFDNYVRPVNTAEALEVLRYRRGAKVVGGGMWMRLSSRTVPCVVDLSDCGLGSIAETDDAFEIGAMASLRDLETHRALNEATGGILERAVRDIVGSQFRELATVGGSVYGRFGFSDVLCALLALDADVVLTGAGRMPLARFCEQGYEKDILERVVVAKRDYRAAYACVRRAATDLPTLNVAAAYWNGDWHVAVGARPARPAPARFRAGAVRPRALRGQAPERRARPARADLQLQYVGFGALPPPSGGCARHPRRLRGGGHARPRSLRPGARPRRRGGFRMSASTLDVKVTLNGRKVAARVPADQPLYDFVRAHGCKSVKCACETTNCGLCTVWLDGRAVLSCAVPMARADGHAITTLEGLREQSADFARCMAEEGAEQCGFCSPGLIMNVLAYEREVVASGAMPSDEELDRRLSGNLCRCSGYMGQRRALKRYLAARLEAAARPDAAKEA